MRAAPGLYPVREISPPDTHAAFPVLAGPYGVEREEDLQAAEEAFVDRVDNVLRPDGYRLAGAFPPESDIASGVVGFRLVRSNFWGDHLWVDEFIAAGLGVHSEVRVLLHFLKDEARRLGVTQIHLDVIPPELAEGPKDMRRSFADDVEDFAKVIEGDEAASQADGDFDVRSPLGNRICASETGFLYAGQRHILVVERAAGSEDESGSPTDQDASFLRPLGRPFPPRRGHI